MQDRIPTQIIAIPDTDPIVYAIRHAEYNGSGQFQRYVYLALADEPEIVGTPLNNETLLKNETARLRNLAGVASTINNFLWDLLTNNSHGIMVSELSVLTDPGSVNNLRSITYQEIRRRLGLGNTLSTLPVANGGTGVTTAQAEVARLFPTARPTPEHFATFASGMANAGWTTPQQARNNMGLGNTLGALPLANGGTGQTTLAAVRNTLGIPTLPSVGVPALPTSSEGIGSFIGVGNNNVTSITVPSGGTWACVMLDFDRFPDHMGNERTWIRQISAYVVPGGSIISSRGGNRVTGFCWRVS